MKKLIIRTLLILIGTPIIYFAIAFILTYITVNSEEDSANRNKTIFLSTNGVHIDIIIPRRYLEDSFISDLKSNAYDQYFAFGWGDRNFYINTPTWNDLTFENAFQALFMKSQSLMHVTRYPRIMTRCQEVKVTENELKSLIQFIDNSFAYTKEHKKIILEGEGYFSYDDFYEAKGSYSLLYTCNTWANEALKQSNLKACLWTPFDYRIMQLYADE